ncbi:ABC transporter permease [Vaginella massiliensis]|uniref:ABC transporter permease n=1 Tax=Vaginella massiliensis TaxID=1816680 RepID=UPI00083941D8|nr:ABC transporter permease [Vaginella massiliensis]
MLTILKKELQTYFLGYTAYIAALIFNVVCVLFLWFFDQDYNIFNSGLASLNSFFFIAPWVLMFLIPALTMRQIAEEQANGTLLWLFTQPINIRQIILEKYASVIILVLFILLFTLPYLNSLEKLVLPEQNIDYGIIWCGYLGLILLGSLFAAVGIFASSLTKNQVMAYILAMFFNFILFFGFQSLASYNLMGSNDYIIQKTGAFSHYNQFLKGILDTRSLIYFVVVCSLFLIGSMMMVERKKIA